MLELVKKQLMEQFSISFVSSLPKHCNFLIWFKLFSKLHMKLWIVSGKLKLHFSTNKPFTQNISPSSSARFQLQLCCAPTQQGLYSALPRKSIWEAQPFTTAGSVRGERDKVAQAAGCSECQERGKSAHRRPSPHMDLLRIVVSGLLSQAQREIVLEWGKQNKTALEVSSVTGKRTQTNCGYVIFTS